ncbi:ABC transporter substrate-binding protein [Rhodoplanes sp. Z2-YC6860]|uniref:ABC transporter substrate-binding protein n=1 Tax=Rhodoplanes sp. Z2-YC6860 TaxID=674703 RepID=UPI00078E1DC7|nr:ABC transporter substrate-binding protein [Rhodoplanes sp. Z2-YC6860]AMN44074.1 ABC transporter substrate binding protein [Rhodoplanes sp. Z2-YC6860]
MRRRKFLGLVGSASIASPISAWGQAAERVRNIGVLLAVPRDDLEGATRIAAFRRGLEELGWIVDRNIRLHVRFAASSDQAPALAKEIVGLRPEVVMAHTTGMVEALRNETSDIPIVFINVSDPIGSGFVTHLARPNSNVTGFMLYDASIAGKWLSMLKEIAPHVTRVAFVGNPKTTPFDYYWRMAESLASALAIKLVPLRIESATEIVSALEAFAQSPNGGFLPLPDPTMSKHREVIIDTAARLRLPAVYTGRYYVVAGGLLSYETDRNELSRQAATYVDRILRGEKPVNLPVQVPVNYKTTLNLRTAKALGLTVPPGLLVSADDVIE